MAEVIENAVGAAAGMPDAHAPRETMYLHIREVILDRIERGEYAPGSPIPSENDLAEEFDTTRLTVRNAIDGLIESGSVRRIQGKGAYVMNPLTIEGNGAPRGFRERIENAEASPSVRQLSKTKRLAGPYFANIFDIDENDVLYVVRRLNSVDGVPIAIEEAFIPLEYFPSIEDIDVSVYSLYEIYGMLGRPVALAQEKLDVVALTAREAGLLQVEPGSLALSLDCLSYDENNRVIEYAYAVNRGDRGGYLYRY